MKILAIDPGAAFGWAIRVSKTKIIHGSEDFKKFTGVDGRVHLKFYQWFDDFLYTARPDIVVSEDPIFRGKYSEYLYGFSVIISLLCFKHNIPTERVNLSTIKKSIAGHGKAEKVDMIAALRNLGFEPNGEHDADALAILIFKERHSADQEPFTGKAVRLKPRLLNTIKRKKRAKV